MERLRPSNVTFIMKNMDGQEVSIRHGHTITYSTDGLSDRRQEELFDMVAYYGYIAAEKEPFYDGIPRTTLRNCIKVRLMPRNHTKAETHKVTISDFLEEKLHDKLMIDCPQYYIKNPRYSKKPT